MPDVVEEVRRLVEGTGLSQAAIAARTGVGPGAIQRWIKQRRWVRPLDASRWPRAVAIDRAGLGRRFRVGFERVQHLAEQEAERLRREDPPDVPASRRAARLANAAARAASMQDTHDPSRRGWLNRASGDGMGRLRVPAPTGGQGQAYADDVVAIARRLVETTLLKRDEIARQVGGSATTISEWTRVGGWTRPAGAEVAPRSRRWRVDGRWLTRSESTRRLSEAESQLDALGPAPQLDEIAHALDTLLAARAAFRVGGRRGGGLSRAISMRQMGSPRHTSPGADVRASRRRP